MGDTYYISKINCAYCGKENNFVNAKEPFCEMGLAWQFEFGADFVCEYCKRKNKIVQEFKSVKLKKSN
jgi:hypothetical protein